MNLALVPEVGRPASHHGNPFDHQLIAQARVEGLSIVTPNPVFADHELALVFA